MPALSPTMTEGNVSKWLKKVGDNINSGDVIAEVETDKATMEVEAVDEGKLAAILRPNGAENVPVNDLIGVIAIEGDTQEDIDSYIDKFNKNKNEQNMDTIDEDNKKVSPSDKINDLADESFIDNKKTEDHKNDIMTSEDESYKENSRILISPLAKRIAQLEDIDITKIKGSGPQGRIIKRDLDSSITKNSLPRNENLSEGINIKQNVKLSNIRKTIAKRLQEAKATIPHFYLRGKVEINKLFEERIKVNKFLKENNSEEKITLNDFFIKAIALSLKKVPEMNCVWNDNMTLTRFKNADISVAVATEEGLFTPVIRNACSKSISKISNEMKDFIVKAREGKLLPNDYQGGAFSVSNLGMYEVIDFSAIINPPQSGIIALGTIVEEPKVIKGELSITKTISYTLSVDHRIVDGAIAANFLKYFNFFIKNPISMIV